MTSHEQRCVARGLPIIFDEMSNNFGMTVKVYPLTLVLLGGFCCVEICNACIKCFTVDQGGGGLNRGMRGFTVDCVGESKALWSVVWGARWGRLGSRAFYWGRGRTWTFLSHCDCRLIQ